MTPSEAQDLLREFLSYKRQWNGSEKELAGRVLLAIEQDGETHHAGQTQTTKNQDDSQGKKAASVIAEDQKAMTTKRVIRSRGTPLRDLILELARTHAHQGIGRHELVAQLLKKGWTSDPSTALSAIGELADRRLIVLEAEVIRLPDANATGPPPAVPDPTELEQRLLKAAVDLCGPATIGDVCRKAGITAGGEKGRIAADTVWRLIRRKVLDYDPAGKTVRAAGG